MEGMKKVYRFLDEAGTYYLATVEGDQPRVRPFPCHTLSLKCDRGPSPVTGGCMR